MVGDQPSTPAAPGCGRSATSSSPAWASASVRNRSPSVKSRATRRAITSARAGPGGNIPSTPSHCSIAAGPLAGRGPMQDRRQRPPEPADEVVGRRQSGAVGGELGRQCRRPPAGCVAGLPRPARPRHRRRVRPRTAPGVAPVRRDRSTVAARRRWSTWRSNGSSSSSAAAAKSGWTKRTNEIVVVDDEDTAPHGLADRGIGARVGDVGVHQAGDRRRRCRPVGRQHPQRRAGPRRQAVEATGDDATQRRRHVVEHARAVGPHGSSQLQGVHRVAAGELVEAIEDGPGRVQSLEPRPARGSRPGSSGPRRTSTRLSGRHRRARSGECDPSSRSVASTTTGSRSRRRNAYRSTSPDAGSSHCTSSMATTSGTPVGLAAEHVEHEPAPLEPVEVRDRAPAGPRRRAGRRARPTSRRCPPRPDG